MKLDSVKAAVVDIVVDDEKLTNELLNIPKKYWTSGTDPYTGYEWQSIFLRKNDIKEFSDFKTAKSIGHDKWYWDDKLHIPYIKELVSSLPVSTVGMIRAFVLNGPLAIHNDSNDTTPNELSFKLGLTIASKLDEPMMLDGKPVIEKYVLFNDSVSHGFPDAKGTQISIRVFGDFEYSKFKVTKVYE